MTSATKTFVDWIHSTAFEDIPPDVRRTTIMALYDDTGANLACSLLPLAHIAVRYASLVGGRPDCTIVGFPERTSVLNAAMVNGTIGHGNEVDCTDDTGQPRTLPALIAAALAAGQTAGAPGKEVVRAVALGHEMSHRIHRVQDKFELETGNHSDLLDVGHSMGSAVAASICLGLDQDRIEAALSLAATMVADITPPIDREYEHMVKSFMRGGVGSRNGVAAAFMAQAGFDAPPDIFDGPRGFFNARLGIGEPGPEFADNLGQEYSIARTRFKRASAGGPNQGARLALVELMAEHNLTHEDIAEIQVVIGPGGLTTITSVPHPTVYYGYVLANAAVYGGIGFLAAHDEALYNSPEVSSLRERIHIRADATWPTRGDERYRGSVTIITRDGSQVSRESLWRRMSEEEVDAKFIHLAGLRVGEEKAKELGSVLQQLDSVDNISDVLTQLEIPATRLEDLPSH